MRRIEVRDDGGNALPMSELFAWVAVHGTLPDGSEEESIIALEGDGGPMPLVAQQERLVRAYTDLVRAVVQVSGKPARLVRFTGRVTLDEVLPGGGAGR